MFSAIMALVHQPTPLPPHTQAEAFRLMRAMLGHFSPPNVDPNSPELPMFTNHPVAGLQFHVAPIAQQPTVRLQLPARGWGKRRHNLGIYRVEAAVGTFALGDCCYLDEEAVNPCGGGRTITVSQRPTLGQGFRLLAHPTDYQQVGTFEASGDAPKGVYWMPVPPAGYVALGVVATAGDKPQLSRVMCVHTSLTVENDAAHQLCSMATGGKLYNNTDISRTFRPSRPGRGLMEIPKVKVGPASVATINQVSAHLLVSLAEIVIQRLAQPHCDATVAFQGFMLINTLLQRFDQVKAWRHAPTDLDQVLRNANKASAYVAGWCCV